MSPLVVFTWNAMGSPHGRYLECHVLPTWSDINVSWAPPWSSMQALQRQLAYHVTCNGPTLVHSAHGYSEKTHIDRLIT